MKFLAPVVATLAFWERTDGYPEYNRFAPGTALVLSPVVAIAVAAVLAALAT